MFACLRDRECCGGGGGRHRPASAGLVLEWAVAGGGLVDPGEASGGDVEVGLDYGDRRRALVAGDVHVPETRVEEAGAGPVPVRRARRVVAVVDRERSPDDDDEGRAGVRVPAGRAAGVDGGGQDDRISRVSRGDLEAMRALVERAEADPSERGAGQV